MTDQKKPVSQRPTYWPTDYTMNGSEKYCVNVEKILDEVGGATYVAHFEGDPRIEEEPTVFGRGETPLEAIGHLCIMTEIEEDKPKK